jgi:glutathione peroxidase
MPFGPKTALDFTVKTIEGKDVPLSRLKGKAFLIVNTASKCGYTPQYESLEKLYNQYKGKGLRILAFPANDFGAQEPGSDKEIKEFCTAKFHVTFDMFSKVTVAPGDQQAPLYKFLTGKETNPKSAGPIRWNFTKFLLDEKGQIVGRFEPGQDPMSADVIDAVEKTLKIKKDEKKG